jgi:hypothetical protein
MCRWRIAVEPTAWNTRILVTDPEGNELLKAALPTTPTHPRALLTLLEGLALWAGEPLTAAIYVGSRVPRGGDRASFGASLGSMDSPLVHFDQAAPIHRRRALGGVGDFRRLRLILRGWL